MEPGEPCVICGVPLYVPITPWKANDHDDYIEDGHEYVGADEMSEQQVGAVVDGVVVGVGPCGICKHDATRHEDGNSFCAACREEDPDDWNYAHCWQSER